MSGFDAQDAIVRLFLRLRRGYGLGLAEYRAALEAAEAGFAQDEAQFLELVGMLWCHSREQLVGMQDCWAKLQREEAAARSKADDFLKERPLPELDAADATDESASPKPLPGADLGALVESQPQPLSALPVQAPRSSVEWEESLDLRSNFPLSRRSMVYGWRSLRRMVAVGGRTELDVGATVDAVVRQGGYAAPVYRCRRRNLARLLLLIDQNGSMMPFHRFTRDLVETAQVESPLQPENVQVFYFQNVPGNHVYRDVYLTEPIALDEALADCDEDTSILVVSDGGAARGIRRQERIQATTRVLRKLKRRSPLLAWLNPLSVGRWEGSSAEILRYLVPMFAMDRVGFGNAIDVVRGVAAFEKEEGAV
jgi:uncharacterized protein